MGYSVLAACICGAAVVMLVAMAFGSVGVSADPAESRGRISFNRDTKELFRRFGIEQNVRSGGWLDLQLRCLVRLLREIRDEAASRTGIPWSRRFRAWRMGFRSRHAAIYQLDDGNASGYVPDYEYAWRCYTMNGFWNPIVGNKLVVSQVLAAYGIPHPRVFGVVSQGRPLPTGPGCPAAAASLHAWTANARPVVFRPHWSGGGEGVFFVRRDRDTWFINGRDATEHEVVTLIAGIEGVTIPALAEAIEGVLAAARCFPEATCVGWDLLITDDGFSILEANAPPGIIVSQAHSPLLANQRVARFFRRHGFRVPAAP